MNLILNHFLPEKFKSNLKIEKTTLKIEKLGLPKK